VDIFQPPDRPSDQLGGQVLRFAFCEKPLRFFIGKRFDHSRNVNCHVTVVKYHFRSTDGAQSFAAAGFEKDRRVARPHRRGDREKK
jgi:hypothetical protein